MSFCDHDTGCITCGDVAMELTVVKVDTDRELALCATGEGERETVQTGLVGVVRPGDALLVHAGTALQRVGA